MTRDWPWPVLNEWPNTWQIGWYPPIDWAPKITWETNIVNTTVTQKSKSELIDQITILCLKYSHKRDLRLIDQAKDILAKLSNDGMHYNEWLILHLLIVNAESWVAQDNICESQDIDIVAEYAKIAQARNKERVKDMANIDGDPLKGEKTY